MMTSPARPAPTAIGITLLSVVRGTGEAEGEGVMVGVVVGTGVGSNTQCTAAEKWERKMESQ